MKTNTHIEIVASTNPRLNAMASGSQQAILQVLSKHYSKVGITIVNTLADLNALVAKRPDLVVLGMKQVLLDESTSYEDSPKLWLSSHLKQQGITFVGSEARALATQLDKPLAKQQVLNAGLRSAAYFIARIDEPTVQHSLQFPLFVKPTNKGGSKGIDENSVVHTQLELETKVAFIHRQYASDALVEEYLSGREFSVAVIARPVTGDVLAMPVEITTGPDSNGHSFLSEAVKKADTEQVIAVNEPAVRAAVNNLAIGVFEALGARDYGRIDVRLDAFGVPSFIEANLRPGLSTHGYLSRCFSINQGASYEDMILSIVSLGLARNIDGSVTTPADVYPKRVVTPLASPSII